MASAALLTLVVPPLRAAAILVQACLLWEGASFVGTLQHHKAARAGQTAGEKAAVDDDTSHGTADPSEREQPHTSRSAPSFTFAAAWHDGPLADFLISTFGNCDPKLLTVAATVVKIGVTAAIFQAVLVTFGPYSGGGGGGGGGGGEGWTTPEAIHAAGGAGGDVFFRGDFGAARAWREAASARRSSASLDFYCPAAGGFSSSTSLTPLLWVWFFGILTGHLVFGRVAHQEALRYLRVDIEEARAQIQHEEEAAYAAAAAAAAERERRDR